MHPLRVGSLALLATAAVLFTTADAHGLMIDPRNRNVSNNFRKDCGALVNIGTEELLIGPIELLSQFKQADYPPSPTFNLLNGCRGTVYEEGMTVTTLQAGVAFDITSKVSAPHPGTATVSILKPVEDGAGIITYEEYLVLHKEENYAVSAGTFTFSIPMPSSVRGCDSPGDCVLRLNWYSPVAKQTYPTCSDIIVTGGGGGGGGGAGAGGGAGGAGGGGGGDDKTTQTPPAGTPTQNTPTPSTPTPGSKPTQPEVGGEASKTPPSSGKEGNSPFRRQGVILDPGTVKKGWRKMNFIVAAHPPHEAGTRRETTSSW
ncbi:hypothetical protein PsorP6_015267 [Peronosclerospora sorghi]|uniref:Uncharacterized protein n=1 Tax=Peronosclerospora sorghi TaxID=230839 RepID=A0ACC0VUR2_9STRA|nr:hypothetical protein PsorP6_015267 [Peronosclerospora sorghi]